MEAKMFSIWSVRWLDHEYEAGSTQQSDTWEVGQFSTSQYEARRESECSELVTRQEVRK
jgi:hypothetical protein